MVAAGAGVVGCGDDKGEHRVRVNRQEGYERRDDGDRRDREWRDGRSEEQRRQEWREGERRDEHRDGDRSDERREGERGEDNREGEHRDHD